MSKSYKRVQEIFGTFTLSAQIKKGMKATCCVLGKIINLIMNSGSTYNILQKKLFKHHPKCCEWPLQKGEEQNTNRAGKHLNFCRQETSIHSAGSSNNQL